MTQMIQRFLMPVLIYVFLPLLAGILAVCLRRSLAPLLSIYRRGRRGRRQAGAAADAELRARLDDLVRMVPRAPALLSAVSSHPLSLHVEARLLSGCPSQALAEAEQEVLDHPADGAAVVALAKALLYCQREEEARAALRWAQRLGADDPEFDYLCARTSPPSVEALRRCLRACQREPAYPEALFLCARLSLALGLREEGERLLVRIAPLMHLSVERFTYRSTLSALQASRGAAPMEWRAPVRAARRLLGRLSAQPPP